MNERMGNIEKALEESIYDQHRTDYERKSARQIFQQNRQLLRRRLGRDRCPECPKSRGSEACPKCSPLNFCFLAEHGNSSDDATSKDMCPKCFPRRTFVETLDTATQRRVRRIRARVWNARLTILEDLKAFRNHRRIIAVIPERSSCSPILLFTGTTTTGQKNVCVICIVCVVLLTTKKSGVFDLILLKE